MTASGAGAAAGWPARPSRSRDAALLCSVQLLILGGLGFVLHVLWWIALVVLVLWLLGFLFRSAETSGRGRRRTACH